MTETVGKVVLDYKDYEGQDMYSDGDVEERILDIARHYDKEQFNQVIAEKKDWAVLYHLSSIRTNVLSCVEIKKSDSVLEIGSGCGAITGELARRAGKVTCIELSKRRSLINANQNKDCENVRICVGNFQKIEPHLEEKYDVITLIGVFEYAGLYIESQKPFHEFLEKISAHLKPNGRVLIAIENKFGMKYWAGCQEDHIGGYFSGIEGYQDSEEGIRTFSKKELEGIFEATGFADYDFYYPYPDYKLPLLIYTDEVLPKAGDLNNNLQNFDRERMVLFNETNVYNEILKEELFPFFSNSYIAVLYKARKPEREECIYSKFSNERAPEFAILTEIRRDAAGVRSVRKTPANTAAKEHVDRLLHWKEALFDMYEGTFLKPCECHNEDDSIVFDFVEGRSLESMLDEYLDRLQYDELFRMIEDYFQLCRKSAKNAFNMTEKFQKVFGNVQLPENLLCSAVSNIDMIFGNIIIRESDWIVLDYEWCFDFPVPMDFILYRALHYYVYTKRAREVLLEKGIFKLLGQAEAYIGQFEEMERQFQRYIVGETVPIRELYQDMGMTAHNILKLMQDAPRDYHDKDIQIYVNKGEGFLEEDVRCMNVERVAEDRFCLRVRVDKEACMLRIDPADYRCIVKVEKLTGRMADGSETDLLSTVNHNGFEVADRRYIFLTNDPWFWLNFSAEDELPEEIELMFEFCPIGDKTAKSLELLGQLQQETEESRQKYMQQVQAKESELQSVKEQLEQQLQENIRQNHDLQESIRQNHDLQEHLDTIQLSLSWRITKPIRKIKKLFTKSE